MNLLDQLKIHSKIVADSGDFELIHKFKPVDATTNPSLIYSASQDKKYAYLIDDAIAFAKSKFTNNTSRLNIAVNKLIVDFGLELLKILPGRVSTETDARFSFDTNGIIAKAHEIIALYSEAGIDQSRILIKIASTWEGIKAAEVLTLEGIHCNMTLLFSLPQAIVAADAKVQLISPFVGRILDWYKKNQGFQQELAHEEPGVLLVNEIYNYYKKYDYKTEIMAASFRNTGEILELSGCDLLTISPELLSELEATEGIVERKLLPENANKSFVNKLEIDEKAFRWLMNQDAMATEKLAEGIRKFAEDLIKLENIIIKKL